MTILFSTSVFKKMSLDREIKKTWLFVGTRCNMRCRYCFIKKTNEIIPFEKAKQAVRNLILSPGKEKQLLLYGGEPLLYFDLLKKIIIFAQSLVRQKNKQLAVSVATNGTLIRKEHLKFFQKYNVKLAVSIDGKKETHDRFRVFKNGRSSFSQIIKKLPAVFKNLKEENVCALMAVHPSEVKKMHENFIYLIKTGFKSINIEPIQTVTWEEKERKDFLSCLNKISDYIVREIKNKRFIFLNSVSRILNKKEDLRKNVEISVSGKRASSCFDFYPDIHFDKNIIKLRNNTSQKIAQILKENAKSRSLFQEYIKKTKSYIFE